METFVTLIVVIVAVALIANNLSAKKKPDQTEKSEPTGPIRNKDRAGYMTFIPNIPAEFQNNFEVPHLDGKGGFDYLIWNDSDNMDIELSEPDDLRQYITDERAFRYFMPESKDVYGILWQAPCACVWHHDATAKSTLIWLVGSFGKRFALRVKANAEGKLNISAELTDKEVNIDLEEDYYFNEYKKRTFAFGKKKLEDALRPFVEHAFFVSLEMATFQPLPKATLDFFRHCKKQGVITTETYKDRPMMADTAAEVAQSLIKGEEPKIPILEVQYEDDDKIVTREYFESDEEAADGKQKKPQGKDTQWAPTSSRSTPISDDISVDENGNIQTKIVDGVVVSKDNFSVEVADGLSVHKDGYTTRVAKGVDVHSDGRTTVDVLGSKVTLGEKKKDWKDGFFDSDKDKKKGFFD